jgi:hypothetical protein
MNDDAGGGGKVSNPGRLPVFGGGKLPVFSKQN